jgi:FtsH-binding integral membrane protein
MVFCYNPPAMSFTLHTLGIVVGLLLVSTKLLYKSEQGKLQSKLEDLWIRIDDLQKQALSRQTAFMGVVAETLTARFDRNFGKKLISLQSLIVSVCHAVATLILGIILLEKYSRTFNDPSLILIFFIYLFTGLYPTFIPLLSKGKRRQTIHLFMWTLICLALAVINILVPYLQFLGTTFQVKNGQFTSFFIMLTVGVIIAVALFITFIIIVRYSKPVA